MKIRSVGKINKQMFIAVGKGKFLKPKKSESYSGFKSRMMGANKEKVLTDDVIDDTAMELYLERNQRVNNISIFHRLREKGYVKQADFDKYVMKAVFTKKLVKRGWTSSKVK